MRARLQRKYDNTFYFLTHLHLIKRMTASSSAMDGCDRRFHYPLVTNLFLVLMFNFPLISSDRHTSLVGHLKSLGHHRPPDVVTDELTAVPHPLEFWKQYASKKKPVIFRGAAKHSRLVCPQSNLTCAGLILHILLIWC